MSTLESDAFAQLDLLEQEIEKLTQGDPDFRVAHQRVRAAFTVSEALSDVLQKANLTIDKAAALAKVPRNTALAALTASSEIPATVETTAAIANIAGFKFELQFIPDSLTDSARKLGREVTVDGVPGGVLVKLPSPPEKRALKAAVSNGLKRFALRATEPLEFRRLALLSDRDLPLWELVNLAEDFGFRLQFRFERQELDSRTFFERIPEADALSQTRKSHRIFDVDEVEKFSASFSDRVFKTVAS